MNKAMTVLKTEQVRKITKDMTDDDFIQSVREVLDWFSDGVLVYDGMFSKVAAEIENY